MQSARWLLRRGVRYVLVLQGFLVVEAAIVVGVLAFVLTGSRIAAIDRLGNRGDILAAMIATAITVAALRLTNKQVKRAIDKRFFRDDYDARVLLTRLSEALRTTASSGRHLEVVVDEVRKALHAESAIVLLGDNSTGEYRRALAEPRFGLAPSDEPGVVLNVNDEVVRRLREVDWPIAVESFEPATPVDSSQRTGSRRVSRTAEQEMFDRMNSALLVPIATKSHLLGILSLGPRRSQLPYSRTDKALLMTVAAQVANSLEINRLSYRMAEEEQLRHELEEAASVQRRLLPERAPDVPGIELAGLCRPARGVGGDCYEYLLLDDGTVGIAIADVAGKGMAAALLTSVVVALLRSQAPKAGVHLDELVKSISELLFQSTDDDQYATLFVARYDPRDRSLMYVNAGHNPPMLVRGEASSVVGVSLRPAGERTGRATATERQPVAARIIELWTGGPPVGLLENRVYEQGMEYLQSGDVLVGHTDGVTEAMNPVGDEFGDERLRHVVKDSAGESAAAICARIDAATREWCLDAPQHDDITLVVLRVL